MEWYVSVIGADSLTCGKTKEMPCRNLTYVISLAQDGDTINIDGNQNKNNFYPFCSGTNDGDSESVEKSLEFVGQNGVARIGCESDVINDTITRIRRHPKKDCTVVLRNLVVENGVINVGDCTMEIINSTFFNASIMSLECDTLTLIITRSRWYGKSRCDNLAECRSTPISEVKCNKTDIRIIKSKFYQTQLRIVSKQDTQILISDVLFSNQPGEADMMGGLHLTFSVRKADVLIRDTTFQKQLHPIRLKSVINVFEGALWLKAVPTRKGNSETNVTAELENVRFEDNERGATIIGPYKSLALNRCLFARNIAMHAGAALLVLTDEKLAEKHGSDNYFVYINNCTFVNNSAGKYRQNYRMQDPVGTFHITGNEVSVHSECCKGVMNLVGKGGAIRVQKGSVTIHDSYFFNNTASLLGGSVFVDIDGRLTINKSYFESTPVHEHALQGDILYSDGQKVRIKNVTLVVKTAINALSILRHSGDHWSMDIANVWVQCPVGYNLRATNSSAYGVADIGLRRSHELDQLSYFCESCPRNKYSLDYGFLNYTLVFKQWAYFTLLINGNEPMPAYTGSVEHHEVICADCPYGGQCVQGITAVANFWGYIHENKSIHFQHCPRGYCCGTRKCESYDACADKRVGRLCGRCKQGYAEALFSPSCVSNDVCGPLWLWPFAFSVGLVYAMFLLFQTDLKHFLFADRIECCGLTQKFRNTCKRAQNIRKNCKNKVCLKVKSQNSEGCESRFIENTKEDELPGSLKETPNGVVRTDTDEPKDEHILKESSPKTGFLIILFYYFQDALLLQVDTVYVKVESKSQKLLKSVLSGLFKFQLDLFELIEEVCAVPDMTAAPKLITKTLIVPYVILIFLLMYIINKWICMMRGKKFSQCPESKEILDSTKIRKSFSTRLSSGFILALLFTFQKMGTTVFMLLNCVPVQGDRVLFIDGTVTCYQYWQYGVMTYAISCVSPFFLVLMIGPSLMRTGHISLSQFFLACLCPLPALLWWLLEKFVRRVRKRTRSRHQQLSDEVKVVLGILQGPFRDEMQGVCWAGVLIGRRLVIILLYTFVNDALIRLLCMLLTCFVILLHHVHVQPYKDTHGNIAGTASAAALVTLGSINLVRAGFEAAEYTPTGPNEFLMKAFDEIENALMLWFPLSVMSFVALVLIIRIGMVISKYCCKQNVQVEIIDQNLVDGH